jgi:hypothetical protein
MVDEAGNPVHSRRRCGSRPRRWNCWALPPFARARCDHRPLRHRCGRDHRPDPSSGDFA